MTDYSKLVDDLRDIEKTMFALGTSPINMDNASIRLAYDKRWGPTANDAADAIEELMKETAEAWDTAQHWAAKAQEQMPKRGEWKTTRPDAPMFGFHYCSICGRRRTSPQDNYCPNCGAKMMEVQE